MSTFRILAYKRGSKGATNLRDALRALGHNAYIYDRERHEIRPRTLGNDIVINWGNGNTLDLRSIASRQFLLPADGRLLNQFASVSRAINKLSAFNAFVAGGVMVPAFTESRNLASNWGVTVVCRQTLTGHSGEGIVIADTPDQLVDAPLYVHYVKKLEEFRVHVVDGNVIDVQQKRKRIDLPEADDNPNVNRIRNLANNWVYTRGGINLDDAKRTRLYALAQQAILALGLNFGAVDVIYNQRHDTFYVLEVNTATGIEGTTAQNYAQAFVNYANGLR